MNYPVKVLEITGTRGECIKMEVAEVFGYPSEPSFRGGYDVRCNLEITVGVYACRTTHYYTATSAIHNFYVALTDCYEKLDGTATYNVYCPENDLTLEVTFNKAGRVDLCGKYRDDLAQNTALTFEFVTDQSYFKEILSDLKKLLLMFDTK